MIVLYHSIYPDPIASKKWALSELINISSFKKQIFWINKYFDLVSLSSYVENINSQKKGNNKKIALTFDDGMKTTFDLVYPFLAENGIPATFFVSTQHIEDGPLLWFNYLNALCFENLYEEINLANKKFPLHTLKQCRKARIGLEKLAKLSGDPEKFCRIIAENYPLSVSIKSNYGGMTHQQLRIAGETDCIEIGAHTNSHPFLDLLSMEKQKNEIIGNNLLLGSLTGEHIKYFAYPGGSYNLQTIEILINEGYYAGFAVQPKNISNMKLFEIGRMGIYSNSVLKLMIKLSGFGQIARMFRIPIG